jgi:hypothetical protein
MAERCRVLFWATWGGEAEVAGLADEPAGVISLVTGDGPPAGGPGASGEQVEGGGPLGVAIRNGELGIDDEGVCGSP